MHGAWAHALLWLAGVGGSGVAVAAYTGPRAAFALLDPAHSSSSLGLGARVGRAHKHPKNPLWGQDRSWETRIDNGYAEVFYDPDDPHGPWRMWYTTFTECASDKRDDQGRCE
jgi:hypothetical protein